MGQQSHEPWASNPQGAVLCEKATHPPSHSFMNKNLLEIQIVERVWTIIPAVILVQIALPSDYESADYMIFINL
jgi:hypothetical protein